MYSIYHNLILINALLTINNYISLNLHGNISKILNLSLRKYNIVTLTSLCTFTKVHVMYVTPEFMNLRMAPLELNRMTKYEKYHLDLLVCTKINGVQPGGGPLISISGFVFDEMFLLWEI